MRKTVVPVGILGLLALLVGCTPPVVGISGSGDVVTREERISDFDMVDASHAFRVDIRQGRSFSVVVRIDDNLVDYLIVEKQGSTLRIGLKPNLSFRRHTAEAEVTMPALAGLELSGASRANVTGFNSAEPLRIRLSGASHVDGDIEAGDTRIDASGASQVELEGSGADLTLDASGASIVDLSDFSVDDADVEASGASKATVSASGTLDVNASGASTVRYEGSPTMGRINTSGASSVKQR